MSLTEPRPKTRLFGIDVVRLLSFIAISGLHFVWVIWYRDPVFSPVNSIWRGLELYSKSISISGHTVLFLSAFLIAMSETRVWKTMKVVLLAAFGWLLFCLFEWGQNEVFWVWDIYPLLALGFASAVAARMISVRLVYLLGVLGFVMTWIPFWEWSSFGNLPLQFRHWVVGDCAVDLADWPILPWIGIIWMPYAIGTYERRRHESGARGTFETWRKWELFAWPVLLALAIPSLGAYNKVEVGPMFACFTFRQNPFVFWSHFVFVVFALRLSLLMRVQEILERFTVVRWIGSLRLSQAFGVAYMTHYALIEAERYFFGSFLITSEWISLLALVTVLPLTEILVRLFERGLGSVSRFRPSEPSKPSA
ncbi:MAG: hypothetical protein V4760_09385 [Bdellovibrionota bacterium]